MITAKEAIKQTMNTLNPTKEYTLDEERKQRRLDHLTETWNKICPPLYQDTKEELINQERLQRVFEWHPKQGRNLWIEGPSGAQKTRLAYLRLEDLYFEQGYGCWAVNAVEMCNRIQIADGKTREAEIERLSKYAVLLIDDLGKEPNTQQVNSSLYLLAEKRLAYKRTTIITANSYTRDRKDADLPTYRRLLENSLILEVQP
jgi:DNA replication protein DnaC